MTDIIAPYAPQVEYKLPPDGPHPAICYQIVYVGTVPNLFPNAPNPMRKVIRLTFELHTDPMMDDGRPYSISKEFTFSANENASLRKFIEAWRGKTYSDEELKQQGGLPISELVGQPAIINVSYTDKGDKKYANISTVTRLMKGMPKPEQINPSLVYTATKHDQAVFDKLPSFIQEKIKTSAEYHELGDKHSQDVYHANVADDFPDDSIPF